MPLNGEKVKKQKVDESDITIDRLASIGQIAAGIAHEVRNPLTAVKGFLQLLKEDAPHNYVNAAYSELDNALNTLQNLLNVSKPDLDDESFVQFNLCSEIESLLYLFQNQIYRVEIKKVFSDTSTMIFGKKNQIKKAIFNLLKNAFEAINQEGTITIKHYVMDKQLFLCISDTGVGIPQEKISMLGTPFFSSKAEGTGMGLTQVFTTIYEHAGTINVNSSSGKGTTFMIQFPIHSNKKIGVNKLELQYTDNQSFIEFYEENKFKFDKDLSVKAAGIIERIKESKGLDDVFILHSTQQLIVLLNENNEHGIILQAKKQGLIWAKYDFNLILVHELFQLIRKIYWDFLYTYYTNVDINKVEFFELERNVNFNLDTYIMHFSSSFSDYKNELLESHREIIDELSVPVISLSDKMAVLPIIGTVDTQRAKKIQEHVLQQVFQNKYKLIIIDLSGVAYMDTAVVMHLYKIINGIRIQGCKAVMTGIRPEITNTMVELGIEINEKIETKVSLQQAIKDYTHQLVENN